MTLHLELFSLIPVIVVTSMIYLIHCITDAFCIALCFKTDSSNANNLQMEKKKSKALDDFYIPNSGSGVVLEMYFSCDE